MKARRWRDGIFEYLVVWEPKSNGDPWDDTWEPENYITEELKDLFKSTLELSKQRRRCASAHICEAEGGARGRICENAMPAAGALPAAGMSGVAGTRARVSRAGEITYISGDA